MKANLESAHSFYRKPIGRFVWQSVGWHLALLGFFYVFQADVLSFMISGSNEVIVVKSAVQVSMVAMPKMTLKELQSLEATRPIESSEPVEEIKAEKAEPEQLADEDFSSMLKTFSKKKVKEKTVKHKKRAGLDLNNIDKKKLQALVKAGNKLSEGSGLTGEETSQFTSAFVSYIEKIRDQIRPYWKLPSFLADQELSCRIRLYISRTGALLKTEIIEPSGNNGFDERAKNAIYQAVGSLGNFEAPAREFSRRAARGDIVLGFPI